MSKISDLLPRMNRGMMMGLLSMSLIMMVFSGFKVWQRVQKHLFQSPAPAAAPVPAEKTPAAAENAQKNEPVKPPETSRVSAVEPAKTQSVPETKKAETVKKPAAKTAAKPAPKPKKSVHKNILFQYRDSIPKTVSVVGDFNDWDPEPMTKSKTHTWTLSLQLEPGEYAYNFVVDGRLIRDPSNRKSKSAGQRIPSSIITVK